eukprot:SAG31_NODE_4820_length_2931_cov_2.018008_3_plen_65_part_00
MSQLRPSVYGWLQERSLWQTCCEIIHARPRIEDRMTRGNWLWMAVAHVQGASPLACFALCEAVK